MKPVTKYIIIGVAVVVIFLISRKAMAKTESVKPPKPTPTGGGTTSNVEAKALSKILNEYGRDTAKKVEQMFRWETAHFKSGGYKKTNGAGMEAVKKDFPYGWNSKLFEGVKTDGLVRMIDSGGRDVQFIKFATPYDGMKVLANFLQIRKLGSWYSLNADAQKQYETKVLAVVPKIVNTL